MTEAGTSDYRDRSAGHHRAAARKVFESFRERMKVRLNGREERALKLAVKATSPKRGTGLFGPLPEGKHAYLVDLERGFCNCPDSQKGHICKHRLAAYLIEQSMKPESGN